MLDDSISLFLAKMTAIPVNVVIRAMPAIEYRDLQPENKIDFIILGSLYEDGSRRPELLTKEAIVELVAEFAAAKAAAQAAAQAQPITEGTAEPAGTTPAATAEASGTIEHQDDDAAAQAAAAEAEAIALENQKAFDELLKSKFVKIGTAKHSLYDVRASLEQYPFPITLTDF